MGDLIHANFGPTYPMREVPPPPVGDRMTPHERLEYEVKREAELAAAKERAMAAVTLSRAEAEVRHLVRTMGVEAQKIAVLLETMEKYGGPDARPGKTRLTAVAKELTYLLEDLNPVSGGNGAA